jgi:hypothetical protein
LKIKAKLHLAAPEKIVLFHVRQISFTFIFFFSFPVHGFGKKIIKAVQMSFSILAKVQLFP